MTNTIFKDLKVIELAGVLAGPAVGMFFAELGARVIKVENARTGGDITRHWKLPIEDASSAKSAYFFSVNWGKESVFVDLRLEEDLKKLLGWLREADVVVTNFKAGSAKKLGLDFASLRKLNSRLIYGSISAYGKTDPRPGFDVAMQAETGWLSMNGDAGGPPCRMPVALIDLLAAHQLKQGILLALLDRERTGKGSEVHVSLFDASVSALANQASNWLNLGIVPHRMGSLHPNIAPYGEIFETKDKQPLILSTGTEQHFLLLCECLELHAIPKDKRFGTNANRLQHRQALHDILEQAFVRFSMEELTERFQKYKVPVAPIKNLKDVFEMPAAQKLVLENELADGNKSRRVRTTVFDFFQ